MKQLRNARSPRIKNLSRRFYDLSIKEPRVTAGQVWE
jgi:hypothetical protein